MARMIYQHATTKADQAIAKALGETISAARDDKASTTKNVPRPPNGP
jgi:hypothetical protein